LSEKEAAEKAATEAAAAAEEAKAAKAAEEEAAAKVAEEAAAAAAAEAVEDPTVDAVSPGSAFRLAMEQEVAEAEAHLQASQDGRAPDPPAPDPLVSATAALAAPAAADAPDVGFSRIVASEIEPPIILMNLV
jgi:hypothetical protein